MDEQPEQNGSAGSRALAWSETPVARTVRSSARRRVDRVTGSWMVILQTALACAIAWALANLIIGNEYPFFAPVSAVLSLSIARGQPRRRAVELVLGVAVGIIVADIIGRAIGTGTVQIGVVVGLTMAAALLVGGGTLLVNQAAVSAILVMTVPSLSSQATVYDRWFDALIGGVVAFVLSQVVFPRDPVQHLGRSARPVLEELATALEESADALGSGDLEPGERALERVRALDSEISAFYDALAMARETAWLSPPRRRARGHLRLYADAARQVDYAVRNVRVLIRAANSGVREHGRGPAAESLAGAVRTLASAVRALEDELTDPQASETETRRLAHEASEQATAVLTDHSDLRTTMIVGQVRATTVDLLRGTGMDTEAARATVGPFSRED